ncbi:uncharacterized protein ACDP82_016469 [Pangshura tecta]
MRETFSHRSFLTRPRCNAASCSCVGGQLASEESLAQYVHGSTGCHGKETESSEWGRGRNSMGLSSFARIILSKSLRQPMNGAERTGPELENAGIWKDSEKNEEIWQHGEGWFSFILSPTCKGLSLSSPNGFTRSGEAHFFPKTPHASLCAR